MLQGFQKAVSPKQSHFGQSTYSNSFCLRSSMKSRAVVKSSHWLAAGEHCTSLLVTASDSKFYGLFRRCWRSSTSSLYYSVGHQHVLSPFHSGVFVHTFPLKTKKNKKQTDIDFVDEISEIRKNEKSCSKINAYFFFGNCSTFHTHDVSQWSSNFFGLGPIFPTKGLVGPCLLWRLTGLA